MKGTVAALAASPLDANGGSIIAAGTWTRWIGLYDLHRTDKAVANWAISHADDDDSGQGIVQVRWSPCGRYLVVNERHAPGFMVYDIRGSGQLLSTLRGRDAPTQQRMTCDVFPDSTYPDSSAFEVWAGTHDGSVAVWEKVGLEAGPVEPSWSWGAHTSPVGSTALHSSGSVAATCSGGWGFGEMGDTPNAQEVYEESSVKVWSVGVET